MSRPILVDHRMNPTMVLLSMLLIMSGLVHVPLWWWSGQPWEGAVTWRKPILFGISGGLTLWSLAWVWSLLPRNHWDEVAKRVVSASLLMEVGLITLQIWRGEASHFNRSNWWNDRLDEATLLLVTVVVIIIGWLTIRTMKELNTDPVTALAVRWGMMFLLISCGLGYTASVLGYQQIEASLPPEKYGSHGVIKFPHGACLHAIQTLPLLGWVRRAAGFPANLFHMRTWVAAHAAFLIYAIWQTSQGLDRFQPNGVGVGLLTLTGALGLLACFRW